jgi:hypothetical protein
MRLIRPGTERKRSEPLDWASAHKSLVERVGVLEADKVILRLRGGLQTARRLCKDLNGEYCEMIAWGCSASHSGVLVDFYDKDLSVAIWLHFPKDREMSDYEVSKFPQIEKYYSPIPIKFVGSTSIVWRGYK